MSSTKFSNEDKKDEKKEEKLAATSGKGEQEGEEEQDEENTGKVVGDQKVKAKPINTVHTIVDVLGKDDNVNRIRNVADTDITDKWSFDTFPIQLVLYLGDPPKRIDYIRVASENEQPYTLDFANSNTLKGFDGKSTKGTLKRGLNDIKVASGTQARYIRFEFSGNRELNPDKNQKPDPLGIYYVQAGQGEIDTTKPMPAPGPIIPPTEEEKNPEPTRPTEGRIKDWGADINKGADKWKIIPMKSNRKFYKVTDERGVNIADLFSTPENAKIFVAWHQWKQGKEQKPPEPEPNPNPGPVDPDNPNPPLPPSGTGTDKNGVNLLFSKGTGSDINYSVKNNFRDDGKRYDFNVGDWRASEATGYFRFKSNPVDDEVSIKWSEKSHSGNNAVQCYDTGVGIKDGAARLRFENPHPNYSGNLGKGKGQPLGTKFIGYKGVKIPQADGSVLIEIYQDTGDNEGDKPANQWKRIFSYTDTKYKRIGAHPFVTLRIDDPDKDGQKNLEAKWMSVARIA